MQTPARPSGCAARQLKRSCVHHWLAISHTAYVQTHDRWLVCNSFWTRPPATELHAAPSALPQWQRPQQPDGKPIAGTANRAKIALFKPAPSNSRYMPTASPAPERHRPGSAPQPLHAETPRKEALTPTQLGLSAPPCAIAD